MKTLLQRLDLGSSVAEHDAALDRYFVETQTFLRLVEDKGDIVAGDKGTGKTALYRILKERYTQYDALRDVDVVAAFNPAGTPIFQRAFEAGELTEAEYTGVWKAYFFSLAGNWLLGLFDEPDYSESLIRLDRLLAASGLRVADDSAETTFSKVINTIKGWFKVKRMEGGVGLTETGLPLLTWALDFNDEAIDRDEEDYPRLRHDDALKALEIALSEQEITVWLVMDRLDEAFQARPEFEKPALRALFRSYLDLLPLHRVRVKIFVRRDLFRRIIEGGFVNLTHINARRIDIEWTQEDLYSLLYQRIRDSDGLSSILDEDTPDSSFGVVFPSQVDYGSRKPTTWTWMVGRIGDGNDVKPPRNLIDLVLKAQEHQLKAEDRSPRTWDKGSPLITGDSLKRGLETLSSQRVEDTLLAEAGDRASLIERFRGGKAHHNLESLRSLLGDSAEEDARLLSELGFLERVGSTYKVPILYRAGLGITQGKAFASPGSMADIESETGDEDDEVS